MAYDEELAELVRAELAGRPRTVEKAMFGGLAFMVGGRMACGVSGRRLMVRLGAAAADAALDEPGVGPFDESGRGMTGWVLVSPEGWSPDGELRRWVARGVGFAESLPAKA